MKKAWKFLSIFILLLVLSYIGSFFISFYKEKPEVGVSFSQFYAKEVLGLDWKKTYEEVLKDLNPQSVIIVAYWQYVEPQKGVFDFEDLDWQIDLASIYSKNIILAVGERMPRWPECHFPLWWKNLEKSEAKKELLFYLENVIKRYKDNPNIKYWQIENEPYFSYFVKCPLFNEDLFKDEISLVKKIDPERNIMATDSGEWSFWIKTAKKADIFGSTLYRNASMPLLGNVDYFFISPFLYKLKAELVKKFTPVFDVLISELQMEPWAPAGKSLTDVNFNEQVKNFSISQAWDNFQYALKTGINKIYIWGVEWWYYRKINGDDSFWELGKKIVNYK